MRKKSTAAMPLRGKFGVFQDANEACAAAQEAFLQLQQRAWLLAARSEEDRQGDGGEER